LNTASGPNREDVILWSDDNGELTAHSSTLKTSWSTSRQPLPTAVFHARNGHH
jgi:hypothetical protein